MAHPYIDDTAAAALPEVSNDQYHGLLDLMQRLGLAAAPHKSQPPCFQMYLVGVFFDAILMSMAIDQARIREALDLCLGFMQAVDISLRELQVLVGKLCHVSKCSAPARRFTARLLDLLRQAHRTSPITISPQARLDVAWFLAFLPLFNGVTLIKSDVAQVVAQVDACPRGAGGICTGVGYYAYDFPPSITQCLFSIAALECFNILVACRVWRQDWSGQHVLLYSDNWAAVCAINSGSAMDPLIRGVIRELWLITASHDIELTVRHRPGADMITADALSRVGGSGIRSDRLERILKGRPEPEYVVKTHLLLPPVLI